MTAPSPKDLPAMTVLAVSGMACDGCASTVARVLSAVPGVVDAQVDLDAGRATITGTALPATLIAALVSASYGAEVVA